METMVGPEPREFAPVQRPASNVQGRVDVSRLMEVSLGVAAIPVLVLVAVRSREREQKSGPARSLLAAAFGASASAAAAIGAFSVGALAVGRLVIGKMKVARLRIDQLDVGEVLGPSGSVAPGEPARVGSPADGGERRT